MSAHGESGRSGVASKGPQRVMDCFGHNIPEATSVGSAAAFNDAEPLYLHLEHCGTLTLHQFMKQKAECMACDQCVRGPDGGGFCPSAQGVAAHCTKKSRCSGEAKGAPMYKCDRSCRKRDREQPLTAKLVLSIFKQILEGLAFLGESTPPYIHHDLKPDNIVVKEQEDGTDTIHLIDFGSTVKADNFGLCDRRGRAATPIYAPAEWSMKSSIPGLRCKYQNFDLSCGKRCGLAFDIFSAGSIFMELISGRRLYQIEGMSTLDKAKRLTLKYSAIQSQVEQPPASWKAIFKVAAGYHGVLKSIFEDRQHLKAFKRAVAMLQTDPAKRPSAHSLLSEEAFKSIETPDDLGCVVSRAPGGDGGEPPGMDRSSARRSAIASTLAAAVYSVVWLRLGGLTS